MKKKYHSLSVYIVLFLWFLTGWFLRIPAQAADLTSTNFIIRDPIIQGGGGYGSSASFQLFSATAQMNLGESSTTTNQEQSGFMYFTGENTSPSSNGSSGSSGASAGSSGLNPGGRGLSVTSAAARSSVDQQTATSASDYSVPESPQPSSFEVPIQKDNSYSEPAISVVSSARYLQNQTSSKYLTSSTPERFLSSGTTTVYFGKIFKVPPAALPSPAPLFTVESNILTLVIGGELFIFCVVICYFFPLVSFNKKKKRR